MTYIVAAKDTWDDCRMDAQLERMSSRPLIALDPNISNFGSFYGRGICVLQFGATIFREPYRMGKNIFVIIEKIFCYVRSFFECLCAEHEWNFFGDLTIDLLSSVVALPARLLTWTLDLLRLFAGIFLPVAAFQPPPTAI
jgi:hypothetical protein